MTWLGFRAAASTVEKKFTTAINGIPATLGGSPVVSVYKGSTTESTAGVTLTTDYDSRTGFNRLVIDTSADGTFYAAGNDFAAVITTGTLNGQSIAGTVICEFSIPSTSGSVQAGVNATAIDGAAWGTHASGMVPADVRDLLGTAWLTPAVAGTPDVNAKLFGNLTAVALPLTPTVAGRTLDVSLGGEAGLDWANIGSSTTAVDLSGTTIKTTQKVDVDTIKTNPVVNGGTVTFPTNSTLASTTNITAGTITTVTNVTNAPTSGDLTATMKTSVQTAADASITANATIQQIAGDLPVRVTKNAALASFPFFMVDSTDHVSGKTGLTVTAQRALDGGALAACANAVSEIGSGYYKISLAATDTNANTIGFLFTATGADPLAFTVVTQVD